MPKAETVGTKYTRLLWLRRGGIMASVLSEVAGFRKGWKLGESKVQVLPIQEH